MHALVAQPAERRFRKPKVGGSMPPGGSIVLIVLVLLLASPALAADPKPLAEVDALRLERTGTEILLLETQAQLLRERYQTSVRELARAAGAEGWTLDLAGRKWTPPTDGKGGDNAERKAP